MCSHAGWYNILRLHVLDWQDKYKAYFLQLEAEKNKTQEVLNQWKSKRDAEVAKIDADYLANVANMTAGSDQYKEWYSEAEEIDKERRKKFHQMVSPTAPWRNARFGVIVEAVGCKPPRLLPAGC